MTHIRRETCQHISRNFVDSSGVHCYREHLTPILHCQAWYASESYSPELVIKAEQTFDCCGSGIEKVNRTTYDKPTMKDHRWSIEHNVFKEGDACYTATANGTVLDTCLTCYKKIQPKVRLTIGN